MTEVILLERVEHLGALGDVVRVRPGFARNYLLPQKKALRATKSNIEFFAGQKATIEASNATKRSEAESLSKKMEGLKLIIIRQAGDMGQLFGSVSARDIAAEMKVQGYTVDKNQIQIDSPIKMLGMYTVKVRLHPEVTISASVNVARSADEAAAQEKSGRAVTSRESNDREDEAPVAVAAVEDTAPEAMEETEA